MVGASRNTTLGLLSAAKIHSSAVTLCSHNRRPYLNLQHNQGSNLVAAWSLSPLKILPLYASRMKPQLEVF